MVSDPALVVDAFVNHGREAMKGRSLQGAKAILGNGLLTSEGETHLRQRRLVQPAFHRDRIASYSLDMVGLALAHEAGWSDGAPVVMAREMSALTLAIVGRTLFGADLTGDMMSMLIAAQEDGIGMTDAQVRDEAMTLVLAGHETTAMTLSWTWLLLSRHPQQAEWLHAELDRVLGGRPPTMADVAALPRTRAAVAESIRRYPPAWAMGRRMLADVEVGGWTLPAGALVIASQFALHRSPRWWASSRAFVPERWLSADGTFADDAPGQPRGAWFPFGWGKRNCIGESFAWTEAVLVLGTLAQRWRPPAVADREVTPKPAITLRPVGGLPMILRRR